MKYVLVAAEPTAAMVAAAKGTPGSDVEKYASPYGRVVRANAAGAVPLADVPGICEAYLAHRVTFNFDLAALHYPEPWHCCCGAEFAEMAAHTVHALAALQRTLDGGEG